MKPFFLVYADHPMCSIDCADSTCDLLNQSGLYEAKLIGRSSYPYIEFNEENLNKADCLVIPGGLGDSDQFDKRLTPFREIIKKYVAKGGKYLGICMGSYFAGSHYLNLIKNGDAVQYVKREGAILKHEKHDVLDIYHNGEKKTVYFHDGAAFIPIGRRKIPAEIVATYTNGDAAAIVQKHKKGKIALIGPHPEAYKWWFHTQPRIRKRWKDCVHHEILFDLIEKLLK